ncbi:MAG: ABC transporter ATP-binding protein [Eubacteriales bacterium]|nr:ABC transporter ATP-binding protein [Eubacteriales bacterium]
MQSDTIISARGLSKIYLVADTPVPALVDVDLDVKRGEFCCIVGTSGSGKSTLLYMLAGIETPTRGSITILGKRTDRMSEGQLVKFRRDNVGFVFQAFNLMPAMTAQQNVALPLSLKGVDRFERNLRAKRMLKAVGLEKHIRHRPMQMSGGQQQRVSIARALVTSPDIIFADEPTGNLDSHTGEEIIRLLSDEVRRHGKTLVMVTHDIEKAKYADQIVHIRDGRMIKIENNRQEEANKHENPGD